MAIEHYEPIDLENIDCITFMCLFTIFKLIFFLRETFWRFTTFAPTALAHCVRPQCTSWFGTRTIQRRTLLEPYFYEGSATPVIDGAHGICQTLLNDISRISLISEHDYETEFVGILAIHPDKSSNKVKRPALRKVTIYLK